MPHRAYVVDVFAERPYAGNPLAVVVGEALPAAEVMQRWAAEFNFSETVFLSPAPGADGTYPVRIFTPAREIAFAGHPILGSAWVVRHRLAPDAADAVTLKLGLGLVPVRFESADDGDVAWFAAPATSLEATCPPEPIAAALGLGASDIDPATPVRRCSAGTAAMIVPVRSLAVLRRSRLDLDAYAPLQARGFPPLVYVFCRETRDPANHLSARFFFEANGVREDPATGNGAAFLGAYLLEHERERELSLRIEQGHEVARPSLVRLRARAGAAAREVHVGGAVVPVFEGVTLV